MIKEFAIDPEVMADWNNFRLLFPDFGVAKGRLIARYPREWAKDVQSLISRREAESLIGPIKAKSMVEQIFSHKHKFIPARREYDSKKDWLRNAESASPFHAIIANKNPRKSAEVIDVEQLDKEAPTYKATVQMKVPRTAGDLAGCAKLLLSVCDELQLVEPHFDPKASRFRKPLLEILEMHAAAPQRLKKLELHTWKPDPSGRAVDVNLRRFTSFKEDCRQLLQNSIPSGSTLRIFIWSRKTNGEKMHPRFLLTEFGGLQYDYGLDEGKGGEERTIVTLLDHDLWQDLRRDYSEGGSTFELGPEGIIQITGKAKSIDKPNAGGIVPAAKTS
jgi:hypothetical protein